MEIVELTVANNELKGFSNVVDIALTHANVASIVDKAWSHSRSACLVKY